MKIQININKKHLIVFMIGLFIIVSGIFVYAQVSGVSHAWDEITGKPNINSCVGADQALKTINLQTGAVTCEADDTGIGGLTSVSWEDISGKPATATLYELGGKVFIFTNSFFRNKTLINTGQWAVSFDFQVRFNNGQLESRIITKAGCGDSDSGWKTGSYTHNYRTSTYECHKSSSYQTGRVFLEGGNSTKIIFAPPTGWYGLISIDINN